jgi:ATP-binding cassette subfamily F protein 3
MHSKDVLLNALKDFGGTVIFVSHDRGFIEALATRVLELTPCKFREFPGSYQYYMEQLEKESLGLDQDENLVSKVAKPVAQKQISEGAKSYEEQKRLKSERRKLEKEEQRLMDEITALEEKKANLEEELSKPEVYSDGAKSKAVQEEIEKTAKLIEETSQKWEEISMQLE